MAARYLEEFSVGQVFETEPVTLKRGRYRRICADGTTRR